MHVLVRISLGLVAVTCALLIFSVQIGTEPYLMLIGLVLPALLVYPLHTLDRETTKPPFALTPLQFNSYLGPFAAALMEPLCWALLVINAIWAVRWLTGVDNVVSNIYSVPKNDTKFLRDCFSQHPIVEGTPTCSVLASFLGNPWPLYLHASGATTCLVIGPLQLHGYVRSLYNHQLHKYLGYTYVFCTLLATVGAVGLMVQTTSGMAASLGFMTLALIWNGTLAIGIYYARAKNTEMHREWMIRNYFYTFSAVPFRFLPGIFLALGVSSEGGVAYSVGTWLTVMITALVSEKYLDLTRKSKPVEVINPVRLHEQEVVEVGK